MITQDQWRELVSVAMLGTDRRDPPKPSGPIADLVADTVRSVPSEQMLAQVAATVAVRRAGVLPGPSCDRLAGPPVDDRPPCAAAAGEHWRHITASWPVLEDEWTLALIANGWRMPPELACSMLQRHRRDPIRRARAAAACGPLSDWLVEHLPELAAPERRKQVSEESIAELAELPIPAELRQFLNQPGTEVGRVLADRVGRGEYAAAHRGVLVNFLARVRADALTEIAAAFAEVHETAPGHGLATVLADLAVTRYRMLEELRSPDGPV